MDLNNLNKKYKEFLEEINETDMDYFIDTYNGKKIYNELENSYIKMSNEEIIKIYSNKIEVGC